MIYEALTNQPQTKRALAEKLRTSPREVELLIQAARLEGVPIVSDQDGYWLTDDPTVLLACADRLGGRLTSQAQTVNALKKTAEKMAGEPSIWTAA